ncbi:MAG: hypothetical protein K8Q97_01355 [Candidatus Andersenbacteria bacterium]|nr:hypothetical protein [Candidatus Andersenbacteria bacterium]
MTIQIRDEVAYALRLKKTEQEKRNEAPRKQPRTNQGSYPATVTYSWMPRGAHFALANQD